MARAAADLLPRERHPLHQTQLQAQHHDLLRHFRFYSLAYCLLLQSHTPDRRNPSGSIERTWPPPARNSVLYPQHCHCPTNPCQHHALTVPPGNSNWVILEWVGQKFSFRRCKRELWRMVWSSSIQQQAPTAAECSRCH